MYTIEQYYSDIHLLTNSLVVKLSDAGIAVNLGLIKRYNLDESEVPKNNWKYYLNLSGQKHSTNSTSIQIVIIETGLPVELTPTVLETYPVSRTELLKYGSYYQGLITKYPDDISYINGCIQPIDINIALSAKDGTILAYNTNLVEYAEFSLIREIEKFINSFLARWHVVDFMLTDELYYTCLLGVLFANIPNKIANIRSSKINTAEVCSFHMEHFFRSHLDIWDDITGLNNASKYWLYKNIRYLIKHRGTAETFQLLLDNVFDANNIGIGEHILFKIDPTLIDNTSDVTQAIYNKSTVKFLGTAKNKSYHFDSNTDLTVDEIINLEMTDKSIEVAYSQDQIQHIATNTDNDVNNNTIFKQKTKIIDINVPQLFKMYTSDYILTIMDNWLYYSVNGSFNKKEVYLEPNTKRSFTLSPYDGYLLLIKFLLKLNNEDTASITNITTKILKTTLDKTSLLNNLFNSGDLSNITDDIISLVPNDPTSTVVNKDSFSSYINNIVELYKYVWVSDCNMNNPVNSANIKIVSNRLFNNETVVISNTDNVSIDSILISKNIIIPNTISFDTISAIKELFLTFTGIDIDAYTTIEQNNASYIDIITKLTSYTVHAINAVDNSKTSYLAYTHNSVFKSTQGLATITDARFDNLEQEYVKIATEANNFNSSVSVYSFDNLPSVTVCPYSISGTMEVSYQLDELVAIPMLPRLSINVDTGCQYNLA